jgi:rubrerythrin
MKKIETVEEAIEFAIEREMETFTLYNDLAEHTKNSHSRDVIEGFAAEELAHRRKLELLRAHSGAVKIALQKADHNKTVTIEKPGKEIHADLNMDLKEALQFAMYLETKSEALYLHMADDCQNPDLHTFFMILTEEETLHYKRFQTIYNETFCQASLPIKPPPPPEPEPLAELANEAVNKAESKKQEHDIAWVDLDAQSIY